jgi:hypothetical protein
MAAVLNVATDAGRALGAQVARLCDKELEGQADGRCATCAGRQGDHLANGSEATLMSFLKSAAKRTPFWCHEHDRPCAAWLAMRTDEGRQVVVPWDHHGVEDDAPWVVNSAGVVVTPFSSKAY